MFWFGLTLQSSALHLMAWDVISTSKSVEDSGVDVLCVDAVDVLVTIHPVDSFCLFSDNIL